jgi:uncharacterized membrane protein
MANNQFCWHERIDGKEYETLDEVSGDECGFAWKSLSGSKHWGSIHFEAQARGVTLINVEMEYVPEAGSPAAQAMEEKVEGDLAAFKRFVENQQKKKPLEQSAFEESNT